jgi:exopolysaccharide biosynthesis polyprenyl glycosylphosphotransferase
MKKSELIFSAILVPLDYIMIVLAALSAYFFRYSDFYIKYIREAGFFFDFTGFLKISLFVAIGWLVIFALAGLYTIRADRKLTDEVTKIFLATSTGILAIVIYIFFQRELFASRFIVLAGWALAFFYVSLTHIFVRYIQKYFLKKGIGLHRIVLIGIDEITKKLVEEYRHSPQLGFKVVRIFPSFSYAAQTELSELVKNNEVEGIIQADLTTRREESLAMMEFAEDHHLIFRYAANLFQTQTTKVRFSEVAGVPVVEVRKTSLDGWGRILKRFFDLILSISFLVILSPLLIALALIVKITSRGPFFVALHRVGAAGKKFKLFKFRSMIAEAESLKPTLAKQNERNDGPLFKMTNDPRVTPFGKIMRRWSLDELPQLVNVAMGQMSIVGPRPHEPSEVARYQRKHRKLLNIKPGMTGMAQVSGRSDLVFEVEYRLDLFYVENWTMLLDLFIIIKTPLIVLKRVGSN